MRGATRPDQALRLVRILDPATRDQDDGPWLRGRFEERVRREWNPVRTPAIEACRRPDGYDLGALAGAVHTVMGGDLDHIAARLWLFWEMERTTRPAVDDDLVRPGAN